jgi:hypothetical protein
MVTNEDERSYTIAEFCRLDRISAPTFYKLKRLGLGPREMRGPLNIVRISHAARLAWQRAMESRASARRRQRWQCASAPWSQSRRPLRRPPTPRVVAPPRDCSHCEQPFSSWGPSRT